MGKKKEQKKHDKTADNRSSHSFFSEKMISQSSVAHCGCNLCFMHPIWDMDTAAGRDNILPQSEECVVHICEIVLSNLPVDLMSQDTGHDNQIFLNVILNQIPRGDVIYKKEHDTWHECSQKVGTKWQTFMLNYCDQDKDVFQNFQLKLDAVIQKVNTVNPANLSYHLVAVEVKEATCTTSSIASRIFDDDDNELLDEERLLLQSQSSRTESEDEYSPYSPEEEKNKVCPELPPFELAPYVLEGFHANTQEVTSLNVTTTEEKKIENVKNKNDSLCDSLHIPKAEFPQSFNSILKSVEKSRSLYCGQGQCSNPCGNHYISDERLDSEDLYIPMIYTGKTDSASMEQRMKTNESHKTEEVQKLAQLLQTAINDKDVKFAQEYSKQLATKDVEVKIDVTLKTKEAQEKEKDYDLKVYIEDKESSGGHITLKVRSADTIRDLKNRMLMKHMFPVEVQYWIIGKRMPKDNETLAQCKIRGQGHSVFLYLVSAKSAGIEKEEFIRRQANPGQEYMAPSPPEARAPVVAVKLGNQPDKRKGSTPTLPVMKQASIPEENLNDKSKDKKKPTPVKVAPKQRPTIEPGLHDTGPEIARILRTIDPHLQAGINIADVYRPGARVPVMHPEEPETVFGWSCDACTFINQPTRPGCEVCGNPRPEDYEVPSDYVMSEDESQRLKMEQLLEQKTKAVQRERRYDNNSERDLDHLILFHDALQDTMRHSKDSTINQPHPVAGGLQFPDQDFSLRRDNRTVPRSTEIDSDDENFEP